MGKSTRHTLFAVGLIVCALAPAMARAGDFSPFARGSFADIRKAHAGRPLIVHFWSVSCPACIAELADWAKISREKHDVDFVFVNADAENERGRVESRAEKAGLRQATNFAFADPFVERLYFEVDRNWSGELPFTALIGAEGDARTVIGALTDPQFSAWFGSVGKAGK